MRLSAPALLAVWAAFFASPAFAGRDERVLKAMDLYDRGELVHARDILAPLVDAPGLSDEDRAQARIFLAASYFVLGDTASARAQLLALHRRYPRVKLDPGYFLPEVVELSERARAEVRLEKAAVVTLPAEPPPAAPPPRPRAPAAPPPAPRAAPGPGPLAWIPFGVGQFARGEAGKGHAFLWSELGALGIGFGGFAYFQSLKRAPSQPWVVGTAYVEDVAHARAVQTFYVSAGLVAAAIAAYGILDAATSSSPAPLQAIAGGEGAGLAVRF